jgi:uncharacterized protein
MSGQAVIDSLEFARTGQTLRGSLPVVVLARLQDSLFDSQGTVHYLLRGGRDARQRLALEIEVNGTLRLKCQRCLDLLDYPLRIANSLVLASADDPAAGELEDEAGDWIEPDSALDVATLVEDEIILALPYSPRHAESRCSARAADGSTRGSPFAGLAGLKHNSK